MSSPGSPVHAADEGGTTASTTLSDALSLRSPWGTAAPRWPWRDAGPEVDREAGHITVGKPHLCRR